MNDLLMEVVVVATWNPAAHSDYYTRQTEYYLGGVEPQGSWWTRTGDFGVVNGTRVERELFERLYAGLGVDGRPLTSTRGNRLDRVPAFDVTFSAPKSVSLVWALGDVETRRAVEVAQQRAVNAAVSMLDDEGTFCRFGRGGAILRKASLTAAFFQHGEARPAEHADGEIFADPNLHTHTILLNLAVRRETTVDVSIAAYATDRAPSAPKKIGALHSVLIRDFKLATGATYHAALAHELQQLGFAIDDFGYNGTFEIAGVPRALVDAFSTRRHDIAEELAAHGTNSAQAPALAGAIARGTRREKLDRDGPDRFVQWATYARSLGIEPERLVADLDRDTPREAGRDLLNRRLAALGDELTQRQSTFRRQDLIRAVASAFVGTGLSADDVTPAVAALLESGEIVEIRRDRQNRPVYSTPAMIAIERELLDASRRLVVKSWIAPDHSRLQELSDAFGLSVEQRAAVFAASGANAVAIVEGAAGAGKTHALRPMVAAYQELGCRVIATSTAWRAAKMLREDLGVEARATASWLAKSRAGSLFLDERTVLIVDEAGLLGSRDTHALMAAAEAAGARIVLAGDRAQLQAIDAGSGLAIVAQAVATSRIDTIVRQRQPWMREAVTALSQGRIEAGIEAFREHGDVAEADTTRGAITAAVAHWFDARRAAPDGHHLLIAKSNASVRALNMEVRHRLRERLDLTGEDYVVQAATSSGNSVALPVALGERVKFMHRDDRLGVINGTTGSVEAIDPETDGHLGLRLSIDGRQLSLSTRDLIDDRGRVRLAADYAVTVFSSQGLTADTASILVDLSFDRHDIYVAASRARDRSQLVFDRTALDLAVRTGRAIDRQYEDVGHDERRRVLIERLSRQTIKSTTLQLGGDAELASPEPPRPDRQRRRDRALELGHD